MQFLASVNKSGILSICDAQYPKFKAHLISLANKEIEVVIRKRKKMSTAKQRKYYWGGILTTLGEETGYDPSDARQMNLLHNALKSMFLQYQDNKTGLTMTKSTEDLTTVERNEYHDKIINWALSFHNCVIPLPEDFDHEKTVFNNGSNSKQEQFL